MASEDDSGNGFDGLDRALRIYEDTITERYGETFDELDFDEQREASAELDMFINKVEALHYVVEARLEKCVKSSYAKRGKPKVGDAYRESVTYHITHVLGERDSMACDKELFMESTFVSIPSQLNEAKYSDLSILTEYKQQNSIEQAFRFIKNPVYLGPVYLKKHSRVEALGYVFILVLIIATYIEHRVREALKKNREFFL